MFMIHLLQRRTSGFLWVATVAIFPQGGN